MSQRMIQAAQARSPNGILARAWTARGQALDESPGDRIFVAMLAAYRASGGVARLDTLTRVPQRRGDLSMPSVLQRVS
jgi:hypothetical protein